MSKRPAGGNAGNKFRTSLGLPVRFSSLLGGVRNRGRQSGQGAGDRLDEQIFAPGEIDAQVPRVA